MPRPHRFLLDTFSPSFASSGALYFAVKTRLHLLCGAKRMRRCSTGAANLPRICSSELSHCADMLQRCGRYLAVLKKMFVQLHPTC